MAVSNAASFKNNVTGDESWCFAYDPAMKWHSSLHGLKKICHAHRNFDSRSLEWRSCWWLSSIGRESWTKNLYWKDRLLTLNFTEQRWTDFCKDLGVLGQTRLSHITGSCCVITLPAQLLSSSFLQRKASLFFTTPLSHQIWHPQTKVKSNLKERCFDTISGIENNMTRHKRVFWQVSSVEAFRSLTTCQLCTELGGLYIDC
jgi:hypothetical protein